MKRKERKSRKWLKTNLPNLKRAEVDRLIELEKITGIPVFCHGCPVCKPNVKA